ncbi:MAG TPA: hypothetical protein VMU69_10790, partial [Bradyrhizobium sp.]|nr:hypothetical protein [Bradyrhizobium sp.]
FSFGKRLRNSTFLASDTGGLLAEIEQPHLKQIVAAPQNKKPVCRPMSWITRGVVYLSRIAFSGP